jgi:VCBS repeat protein
MRAWRSGATCCAIPLLVPAVIAAASPLSFTRHDVLSQNPGQLSEGFDVGDLDGDGRPDMIDGGEDALVWYRNPDWMPETIAAGYRYSAGAAIAVADIDRDGRLDVITGRYPVDQPGSREMLWFGNTPGGWVEHLLSSTAFCHDMAFGDVDGDGRDDMLCVDQFREEVSWLHPPADPTLPWTSQVIDDGHRPMGADIADIDGDGRPDAVSGRTWYRNEGVGGWSRHPFTTLANPADPRFDDQSEVDVVDVDGDGRPDIVATLFGDSLQGRLYVFLAPADPVAGPWTPVELDPGPLWGVHSQAVASFDGSPRVQIMIGEPNAAGFGFGTNPAPRVLVYRLRGPARDPASWERTVVDTIGTLEADAVDIDGDGRVDIVGHEGDRDGRTPGVLSWWRNTTAGATPATTTTTLPSPPECRGAQCVAGCAGIAASACAGDRVPAAVERRLSRGCALAERGSLRRAARFLGQAARKATRAARHGRISRDCARAIGALAGATQPRHG